MKNFISLLCFTVFFSNNVRADMMCSDAESKIKYESTQYKGGQAPQPGTLMREEKLTIHGTLMSHSAQYEMCEDPTDPRKKDNKIGIIETQFINPKTILEKKLSYGHIKIFSTLASFSFIAPIETPSIELPEDTFLICQESVFFYP